MGKIEAQNIDLALFKHSSVYKLDDQYWFQEKSDSFAGQAFGLEVKEILYHVNSEYQDILVFKSATFGNVLVLNGIIQCTERDEFAYQEMITNLPIMSHKNPKKVLVIGGGDCGVVRELIKHLDDGVESITMVEIDDMVIQLLAKFLPNMAKFRNHPNVKIVIDDGFKYLKQLENQDEKYDVIITDSSDPEGPAEEFFQVTYFKLLSNALNDNGIVIMQSSENIWLNIDYLRDLLSKAKQVFSNVRYAQCYMPSYTSGQLGFIMATNDYSNPLCSATRNFSPEKEAELFKYYSKEVHKSSFILPAWADRTLNGNQ